MGRKVFVMDDLSLITPKVPFDVRVDISSTANTRPAVSVVVSLYNYRKFIIETLDTIANQTLDSIELLVVDDSSSDSGDLLVESWLNKQTSRFVGARLLHHRFNGGLASARNTGFANANAEWVWVQDADNPLAPRALEQCHRLSQKVDNQVAVIHPLLLTVPAGASPQVFQGEGRIWQKSLFKPSNYVDAMALIRRTAWLDVGGYVHIPGGWEDYDFWCCLIEEGWTGVQCPQVLGSYTYHSKSMTMRKALPNVELLEKVLINRHPWLSCVGQTTGLM